MNADNDNVITAHRWLAEISYAANDRVTFAGAQWAAVQPSKGMQPGSDPQGKPTHWRCLGTVHTAGA